MSRETYEELLTRENIIQSHEKLSRLQTKFIHTLTKTRFCFYLVINHCRVLKTLNDDGV